MKTKIKTNLVVLDYLSGEVTIHANVVKDADMQADEFVESLGYRLKYISYMLTNDLNIKIK